MEEFITLAFGSENDETSEFYIEKETFDWEPVEGTKNGMHIRDGVYLPMLIRNLKSAKNLELKSDDTFVIGYPKSGTTWVEEIVWLLQNNLDFETAKSKFHFLRVFFVDKGFSKLGLSLLESPRVFKSHLPPQFLPENIQKKAKIIYVIRNPKDMLVSTYKFAKTLKEDEFIGSFENLVDNFVHGKGGYGDWWKHVNEYTAMPEVHVVKYEELLGNPIHNINKMCEFLGKNYSESDIAKVVAFTSFDEMKKNPSFNLDILVSVGFFDKNVDFFKKGQIGNWRNYFNDELSKKVDEIVEKLNPKIEFKYLP